MSNEFHLLDIRVEEVKTDNHKAIKRTYTFHSTTKRYFATDPSAIEILDDKLKGIRFGGYYYYSPEEIQELLSKAEQLIRHPINIPNLK